MKKLFQAVQDLDNQKKHDQNVLGGTQTGRSAFWERSLGRDIKKE